MNESVLTLDLFDAKFIADTVNVSDSTGNSFE